MFWSATEAGHTFPHPPLPPTKKKQNKTKQNDEDYPWYYRQKEKLDWHACTLSPGKATSPHTLSYML